jgi:polyribonucleotide nucleotidyltransferase
MLEGGSQRGLTPTLPLIDALETFANAKADHLQELQAFAESINVQKVPYISPFEVLDHPAFDQCISELAEALQERDKLQRERRYDQILTQLKRDVGSVEGAVELTLWSLARAYLRAEALEGRRQDGRAPHELRAHHFETGLLPQAAGSCLVTRDSTQLLVSVTQGGGGDAPTYETLFSQDRPQLFCHYNFPGYATHQLRHGRAPNRREIGHGLLIQRALTPLYSGKRGRCTQLIADVLSSDGSSSMASVLGANLAFAQANTPLTTPLAGVSIGLVTDDDQERAVLLLDITGDEDFYGDMDLKVVGGAEGICALQLDNKLGALPWVIIRSALKVASTAHLQLLDLIQPLLDEHAPPPKVKREVELAPHLAKRVIGVRGATRRGLEQEFKVEIDIDAQKGVATIEGIDEAQVQAASERIAEIGQSLKSGEIHDAVIDGLKDFGVFVSFKGHSGLVHISELRANGGDATEYFKMGESLKVKVLGVDRRGCLKLSHLATQ